VAKNKNYKLLIALAVTVGIVGCTAEEEPDPTASFMIEPIAGDLYKASNASHRTVFVVTDDGIILADPINREFSTWLKAELDSRFGVPVRYVMYTHHHWDHASGGAVFEDTATFVGHENMIGQLALPPDNTGFPADAASMDANGDGRIAMDEAEGAYAANFGLFDYDGDGAITGAEATRGPLNDVRAPDVTFSDTAEVTVGDATARSVYVGKHTHTDDMSVIVFPNESVGFMADFISIVRPPRFVRGDAPIESWIAAVRVVESQGFDLAVGGHGNHAGAEYVTYFREYLEELRDLVATGIDNGQSVEQLQESIYMDDYAEWISYDEFRESNIADMYNLLTQEF
jgi:glyoxylase-like metal-dependent hydrolase (beta-lactamase superfamily II)